MNGTNGTRVNVTSRHWSTLVDTGRHQALISQLEVEQFGRNGDAGPFGCEPNSDPTYGDPPRTSPLPRIHVRSTHFK